MGQNILLVVDTGSEKRTFDASSTDGTKTVMDRIAAALAPRADVKVVPQIGRPWSNTQLAAPLGSVLGDGINTAFLRLWCPLRGGKGGFGQTLKGQGKKMNKKAGGEESKDNYKLLDGRRVKVVRKAREMALLLEKAAVAKKEARQAKKEKLLSAIDATNRQATATTRFTDTEMLEKSAELISDMRDSVSRRVENPKATAAVSSQGSKTTEATVKRPRASGFFGDDSDDGSDDDRES